MVPSPIDTGLHSPVGQNWFQKLKADLTAKAMASEILLHIFVAVISFVPDTLVHLSRIHERFTEVLERSGHTFLYQGYNPRCLSIDFPEVEFSKAMDDAEETLFGGISRLNGSGSRRGS
ncbi:hypothetical protein GH714_037239 [Hevea brasiliensis]|uniref:Uncharacterized protein n=1 Tax=Hevea brasiliensis TaxID=3981 RepID=A0A6A6KVT1_HEVBR|nr:hypothetical protein GH714_037239 [Hevea brasiliensis]